MIFKNNNLEIYVEFTWNYNIWSKGLSYNLDIARSKGLSYNLDISRSKGLSYNLDIARYC